MQDFRDAIKSRRVLAGEFDQLLEQIGARHHLAPQIDEILMAGAPIASLHEMTSMTSHLRHVTSALRRLSAS